MTQMNTPYHASAILNGTLKVVSIFTSHHLVTNNLYKAGGKPNLKHSVIKAWGPHSGDIQ
jgi:hypothetical protein